MKLITRTSLLIAIITIALTIQNSQSDEEEPMEKNHYRQRRAIKKTGPVRIVFGSLFDQWNDTRVTWNKINTLINSQFVDERSAKNPTTTTESPDGSTTTAAYKLTRSELYRILRRNLRGLVRLHNLELREAMKQSERTNREYKKNVTREFSKFL